MEMRLNQSGGAIHENSFHMKKSCCKETIMVFILRINYLGIYCKNIYNYTLRISYPEHLMPL